MNKQKLVQELVTINETVPTKIPTEGRKKDVLNRLVEHGSTLKKREIVSCLKKKV